MEAVAGNQQSFVVTLKLILTTGLIPFCRNLPGTVRIPG
jgi:hypothetical protein